MAAGILNPKDDARATTSRPSESNTDAGSRKWFSDDLATRPRAQDFNRILAQIRSVIDFYSVSDVEGDDTLLRQAIQASATSLSANLTAFSGLIGAANKFPYFTAPGTMDVATVTPFIRTLLDDTSASQARLTLGVDAALSDNVVAFGNLTSATNKLGYFTGVGTMATTDLTSQARQLLDDSSFAIMRQTLSAQEQSDILDNWAALLDGGIHLPATISGSGTAIEITSDIFAFLGASTLSAVRTAIGLGDLSIFDTINNDNWSGADLSVGNGGTGASNASNARTNLGLAIGSDVQGFASNLALLSGAPFTATALAFLVGKTVAANTPDGVPGSMVHNGGILTVERDGGVAGHFNRRTSDGDLIRLYRQEDQVGSISVTETATAYNTTSDGRLKTKRAALAKEVDVGAIIDALEPLAFDWMDWSGKERGIRDHGFVAQDLNAIVPRAVTPGHGEFGDEEFCPWSADSGKLMPYVIADLQRVHRKLEDIEHTLKGLS